MSSLVGPKCLFFGVAVAVLSVDIGIIGRGPVRPLHPGGVDTTSPVILRRLTATGEDKNAVLAISFEQRDDLGLDKGEAEGMAWSDAVLPT